MAIEQYILGGLLLCVVLQGVKCQSRSDLYKYVMEKAEPLVAPMENHTTTLDVNFDLYLFSIQNVDEKNQVFSVRMESVVYWTNKRITWNASLYGNIPFIVLPAENVWFPRQLLIYNAVFNRKCFSKDSTVLIRDDGWNLVSENSDITISCKMSLKYYPFDEQLCTLYYYNSIPNVEKLRLGFFGPKKLRLSYFMENNEWTVTDTSLELKDIFDDEFEDKLLLVNIQLKRKPFFAVCWNLLPVWFLSVMNVVCFLIPAKSGEKMGTCMAIFLTFAVFMTAMQELMPQSSDEIPYFLVYLFIQLAVSGLVVVLEAIVVHVYHQTENSELIENEAPAKLKTNSTPQLDVKPGVNHKGFCSEKLDKVFGILIISINLVSFSIYMLLTQLKL